MKNLIKHLAAVMLLLLGSFTAGAQQYGYTTLTNNTGTAIAWATGDTTNWNAAFTATKYTDFLLEVRAGSASSLAGPINLRWSTSADGVNWATALASPGASGWFAVPLTGAAGTSTWNTNITVNSAGYWRIEYATNQTTVTLTNFNIRAYTKPKRTG